MKRIKPTSQHSFIKIRYAHGVKIIDTGILKFPISNNECVELGHPSLPQALKDKLSYCPIPLAFILHNTNEVFIEQNGRK